MLCVWPAQHRRRYASPHGGMWSGCDHRPAVSLAQPLLRKRTTASRSCAPSIRAGSSASPAPPRTGLGTLTNAKWSAASKTCKFVGIKLHTIGHGVNPLSEEWGPGVCHRPLAGCSGDGPYRPRSALRAARTLYSPAARKYPDLKIILAHAGFAVFTAEAQVAASVCGNLYLETSWCIGEDIRWMIDTIGANRVMLGADLPSNVPVEYAKYKALELAPAVYEKVLVAQPSMCSN